MLDNLVTGPRQAAEELDVRAATLGKYIPAFYEKKIHECEKRIPGDCLLISSLPGKALRTLVESRGLSNLVNLISKDERLVFYSIH